MQRLVAGDLDEFEPASNLTISYRFFCKQITKGDVSVDDVFAAVGRMQVISITLDGDGDDSTAAEEREKSDASTA